MRIANRVAFVLFSIHSIEGKDETGTLVEVPFLATIKNVEVK